MRKLDIGSGVGDQSGGELSHGYEHLDIREHPHVEYVWDAEVTPYPMFEDNTFDELFSSHSIEHFDSAKILNILKEWHRILKPNCRLAIYTVEASDAIRAYINKELSIHVFAQVLSNVVNLEEEKYTGYYHKWAVDSNILLILLKLVGFDAYRSFEDCSHLNLHVEAFARK